MRRRIKLGDVFEIPLQNGKNAYGRLYKEFTLGIYEEEGTTFDEIDKSKIKRYLCIHANELKEDNWNIITRIPFNNDDEAWPPPKKIFNIGNGKYSIYYKGEIIPSDYESCKDLETAAVWDRIQVLDELNGDHRWDVW